jgi:hypothetical protein
VIAGATQIIAMIITFRKPHITRYRNGLALIGQVGKETSYITDLQRCCELLQFITKDCM